MSKKYTFFLWSLLFHSWNQLLVWMIAIKNLSLIFWMHSIFLLFHPKYVSQMSWRNIELPLRRKNGINIWICYWKCYFKWWVIVCGVTWLLIFFPGNSPFPPSICFLVEKRTDECQRGNQSAWVWDTTTTPGRVAVPVWTQSLPCPVVSLAVMTSRDICMSRHWANICNITYPLPFGAFPCLS